MATNYSPKIVTDGLVLCLDAANPKSYPGSGTTWKDLSGNGNDGTLVNGVGYSSDNNGVMTFDGIDDNVQIAYNPSIDFSSGNRHFSIIFWIKFSSLSSIGKVYFRRSDWDYGLGISNSAIRVHNNDSGDIYYTDYSINLNTNKWYHFSQVFTGHGAGNTFFYVDLEQQSISSNNISSNRTVNNDPIDFQVNNPNIFRISNVQIYNRALSESEITQNFNALRNRYGL